jgi:hypothetical protein
MQVQKSTSSCIDQIPRLSTHVPGGVSGYTAAVQVTFCRKLLERSIYVSIGVSDTGIFAQVSTSLTPNEMFDRRPHCLWLTRVRTDPLDREPTTLKRWLSNCISARLRYCQFRHIAI